MKRFEKTLIFSLSDTGNAHFMRKIFGLINDRIFILLLCFISFSAPVSAQFQFRLPFNIPFLQPKPNKLFENRQYYAAAQGFEKELSDGKSVNPTEIRKKIGLSYLRINQPQRALPWLQQAIEGGSVDVDTWYHYGLALQQTANYREAIAAFEQCLGLQPGNPVFLAKIESCRFAMMYRESNPYVRFRPATEINTAGGEFGASLYANHVVYYSQAAEAIAGARIDQRTGLQHVESRMTRIRNNRLLFPQPADNSLPKFVSDGLFAYDSISNTVYFTYCDQSNSRCGIYSSHFDNGRWTEPEIVLQNRRNQVSGHPAIANGGTRLYFTSNITDGFGQTDIWYMDKLPDGRWGQPVNAGEVINTFGREEYPFVYADTLLFFSSDGHIGYGGLDIFCSVVKGNEFSPPVNLRRPFNSSGDDFNFVFNGRTGLLSSSRNEPVSDDIYFFEGLPTFQYLSGYVTEDATNAMLHNARLTLSVDGQAMQQAVSDSSGYYGVFLRQNEASMMYARATGFKPSLTDVPPTGAKQFADFRHDIRLFQSTVLPASIQLYNINTGVPVSERGIICFNDDGETQILRTDASGTFILNMQEDQREYWISFPDGSFLTESIILNDEQKSYSMALQPLEENLFAGWLPFKRGSMEATEMSQALIPRIASVIKANPGLVFQIEGFYDTGFEAYQQELALQRAEYIYRRLVDEGVHIRQLIAMAGVAGVEFDKEEDISQRRVEIKIRK